MSGPEHGRAGPARHVRRPTGPQTAVSGVPVEPREQHRRFAEWPFVVVLVGIVVGLLIASLAGGERFRLGCSVLAAAVLAAALLRAVLPERQAGLLVIRSRVVDVLVLSVLGFGLAVLALLIPGNRGAGYAPAGANDVTTGTRGHVLAWSLAVRLGYAADENSLDAKTLHVTATDRT